MIKKLGLLITGIACASALSFSSTNKVSEPKYIEIDGHKYQYVIGTASKTGSYYKAGYKLTKVLPEAIAAETDGSIQNMDLLNKGVINVAFVQGDAYASWCNSHRAICENDLAVIETNHEEVIQIMTDKKSGIDDDGDLQEEGIKINVGPLNSGGSASWDNMCLLEPNFKKATKITDDAMDETTIYKVKQHKIDALIRTATWDPSSQFVQKAVQSGLRFVDVSDWDLNDKIKINGEDKPIYDFIDVKIKYPGHWRSTTIKTIGTKTFIVINKNKISRSQKNKLFDIVTRLGNGMW